MRRNGGGGRETLLPHRGPGRDHGRLQRLPGPGDRPPGRRGRRRAGQARHQLLRIRILNGTLPPHEELEAGLADFLGCEAALVTTTGFQANLAVGALLGPGDASFSDMANHASLVDAVLLGQGTRHRYRHGDLDHPGRLLAAADPDAGKLIVTDGLFSMEGDLCPLPGLRELADRYGARLVVDGAHDIGLLGARGRGVAEHFDAMAAVDLFTGTFSKCFGSLGGLLAGPARIVDHLRYTARRCSSRRRCPRPRRRPRWPHWRSSRPNPPAASGCSTTPSGCTTGCARSASPPTPRSPPSSPSTSARPCPACGCGRRCTTRASAPTRWWRPPCRAAAP
ncbi:aminotransferase class I/II-fold pyridoxal phosphate-dependent enzyme [Streptomyces sp. 8K308]|nr:aminotransferase class I/II-fold pyridoxal phosphate-dependent enzyme [Streptomyces sp. 8K308]